MRFKLPVLGGVLIALGMASHVIEHIFYGYLDKNGILHESLFLPLGFITGFLGLLIMMIWVIVRIIRNIRR